MLFPTSPTWNTPWSTPRSTRSTAKIGAWEREIEILGASLSSLGSDAAHWWLLCGFPDEGARQALFGRRSMICSHKAAVAGPSPAWRRRGFCRSSSSCSGDGWKACGRPRWCGRDCRPCEDARRSARPGGISPPSWTVNRAQLFQHLRARRTRHAEPPGDFVIATEGLRSEHGQIESTIIAQVYLSASALST